MAATKIHMYACALSMLTWYRAEGGFVPMKIFNMKICHTKVSMHKKSLLIYGIVLTWPHPQALSALLLVVGNKINVWVQGVEVQLVHCVYIVAVVDIAIAGMLHVYIS